MIETGVHFDDIHSFHDLNLILSAVKISPAKPKTNYIDIPGGDGSKDLTEAHGEVKYSDRDITFTFTVFPKDEMTFEERQTAVSNVLNGKRCRITLDKDPYFYYQGRVTVDEYLQDRNLKQFTIKAVVRPYKWKQHETVAAFDLTSAVQTVILHNSKKSVVPTIICTGSTRIVFGDTIHTLGEGTFKVLDICLVEGINTLQLSGSGTVTFTYQEGDL